MPKVNEVMTREFISMPPTTSIVDAVKQMKKQNEDTIMISENGKYRGLVTKDDIVSYVASHVNEFTRKSVASVMNSRLPKVPAGIDIIEAAKIMARHGIRQIPVVQNGKALGFLSLDNLLYESPALAVIVMTKQYEAREKMLVEAA